MESMRDARASRDDIISVVGNIEDNKLAEIIATGASLADLVEAYEWAAADSAMSDTEKSLSGRVARVYDILTADDAWPEQD